MPNAMQVAALILAILAVVGLVAGYDVAVMQEVALVSITAAVIGSTWPPRNQ